MPCENFEDISKGWTDSDIKVSICCITYNHEKYIKQALDSFLAQKTNFAFEILVGEDKGSDSTLDILNKYKEKYPELIKLITSEKNLGANGNIRNVISHAQGDYIAFCEGDDFWVDQYKIQKQYEELIKRPDVKFCFHPAYALHDDGVQIERFHKGDEIHLFSVVDVLSTNGQFCPTSSYMFKKDVVIAFPAWFENAPIGDLFIELYSMKDSGGLYIPWTMSVYRLFSENSWSTEIRKDFNKNINTQNKIIEYTEKCSIDFEPYHEYFNIRISRIYCDIATKFLIKQDYMSFALYLQKSYSYHSSSSLKQKMYLRLKEFPSILRMIHKLKALIKR